MKKPWAVLLLISIVALAYAVCSLYSMPNLLQAQIISPNYDQINLELDYSAELLIDKASVSSQTASINVNLRAVNSAYFNTYYVKLLEGRYLYQGEKDRVALLDKETALKLFPSISPIDKTVKIGADYYTVVGLLEKAPFTHYTNNVYIPMERAIKAKLESKILTYTINTREQSRSEFTSQVPNDNIWEINKERERAVLILKFIFYLAVVLLTNYALRWVNKHLSGDLAKLKSLNNDYYPRQFIPQIALFVLKVIVFYGLLFASYALSLQFIVSAIITFPEFLPEILVDFKLIYESFVSNMQMASRLFVVKSDIITSIEHYARLIQIFATLLLFCICTLLLRERKTKS